MKRTAYEATERGHLKEIKKTCLFEVVPTRATALIGSVNAV